MTDDNIGISDKRRAEIEALSDDELEFEIKQGPKSRFARSLAYLKTVQTRRNAHQSKAEREEDLNLGRTANRIASRANYIAIAAIILSALALLISLLSNGGQ